MGEEIERIKMKKLMEWMRGGSGRERIDRPIKLCDDGFDDALKRYRLLVVDFWADWCMPCKAIAPMIDELARKFSGRVKFAKVNVDECPRVTARFRIMSIPTLMIFRDGEPIDAIVGAMPRPYIEERIERYL